MPAQPSPFLRLVSSLSLAFVTACAAAAVNKQVPGSLKDGRYAPVLAPVAVYGPFSPTDPSRECPQTTVVRLLTEYAAESARKNSRPVPQLDAQLCALTRTLIGWDTAAGMPPEAVVAFVARYFGMTDASPRLVLTHLADEDSKAIARKLVDGVNNLSLNMVKPRFAVTTFRKTKDLTLIALAVEDTTYTMDPLPRRLDLGGKAVVTGKITGGEYENSAVLVADVRGELKSVRAPIAEPFKAEIECGDKPGHIAVQLRGEQGGAGTVLANFPILCGMALPTSVEVPEPAPANLDVAAAEKQLFNELNERRVELGIAPVAWDDAVAKVARGISTSLRDQAEGKPASGSTDIVAQLRAADIVSPLVLQNPARTRSVTEAQLAFLDSPVHRANMLNRQVTHVGIGVAAVPASENQPASVLATELFVKELPVIDTAETKEKLRQAIAQKRADARADKVENDALLDDVAQKYADALAAHKGELPKEIADPILQPLYKGFRSINMLLGARANPLDFAEEPKIISPGKLLGVGVAQGIHPVLGKNAVYVVIFVGAKKK
jgi:uncharacterized protein YkwD